MFKFLTGLFKTEEKIPVGEIYGKQSFVKEGSAKDFYYSFEHHFSKKQLDEINGAYFRKYPNGKYNDLIWSLFNQLTLDYAEVKDWVKLQQIYFDMAIFLQMQNMDSFKFIQLSNIYSLKDAMTASIPLKARISTCDDACSVCKEQDNVLLTLSEALKKLPIPHKNCQHKVGGDSHSVCRCYYRIVTEDNW